MIPQGPSTGRDAVRAGTKPISPLLDPQPRSYLENLRDRKQRLEIQLADVNELIAALESSPESLRIVEALQRVGGY